jgi:hypothetical protein
MHVRHRANWDDREQGAVGEPKHTREAFLRTLSKRVERSRRVRDVDLAGRRRAPLKEGTRDDKLATTAEGAAK